MKGAGPRGDVVRAGPASRLTAGLAHERAALALLGSLPLEEGNIITGAT